MNKTVNINLAGMFFHIDEDAYLKLSRYLEAIKRSFTDSQGRSEIIADIEARIAELFSERIQNQRQVVGINLVDEIIGIMGQPEDYLVDDEIFEDEPRPNYQKKSQASRRLYRDTDNSYVGGVSAGLGHYFGIEALWIRLIWVLLIFGAGTGFLLYILLWALIPEAKTTAEKITMTGDPVNISNIEKKIKDGIDTVSENLKEGFDHVSDNISETVKNVDFQKHGHKLKSSSQNFFDAIGSIILFFLKVIAKFIGILLMIIGISMLIGLIVALFTVGITNAIHFPGVDIMNASNVTNIPIWLISIIVFLVLAIPFFFMFYLGLKILVNNLKSIGNIAKFTLLGLWIMAVIGIFVIGIKQVTERAYNAKTTINETPLHIISGDTLKLKMLGHDYYNMQLNKSSNSYKVVRSQTDKNIITATDIRVAVQSTSDSLATISIKTFARGSSYDIAKERAQNIHYNYTLVDKELSLDAYLTTDISNKFSDQHVEVTVYLPLGTILYADSNIKNFQHNNKLQKNILKTGMREQYLKVIKDDVECLDCRTGTKDPEQKNKAEVNIKINDEDGVNIRVNDN